MERKVYLVEVKHDEMLKTIYDLSKKQAIRECTWSSSRKGRGKTLLAGAGKLDGNANDKFS